MEIINHVTDVMSMCPVPEDIVMATDLVRLLWFGMTTINDAIIHQRHVAQDYQYKVNEIFEKYYSLNNFIRTMLNISSKTQKAILKLDIVVLISSNI